MLGSARRLRARKPGASRGRPGERRRPDPGGPVSCFGLVDLHLDAQVALHHFLEVVAGGLEHLEPAVLPVAHAGKPRRAAAAGPRLGPAALEMEAPVLSERLAEPDVAEARVPGIGEELRGAEGDVLTAEGDPAESIHIEALEWPDAGLLALGRQVLVQVLVERLAERDRGVVVQERNLRVLTSSTPISFNQKSMAGWSFPSVASWRMIDTTMRVKTLYSLRSSRAARTFPTLPFHHA